MRRNWPDEFRDLLNDAEEVKIALPDAHHGAGATRNALKLRLKQEDYEKIWPLAETRFRLKGDRTGSAITLITNNPHYQSFHPSDGGSEQETSSSGRAFETKYVVVHFLLDDVLESVES